jgi:hypothetical protein
MKFSAANSENAKNKKGFPVLISFQNHEEF